MVRWLAVFCIACMFPFSSIDAQKKMSWKEFQEKKFEYIVQYAGLSDKEAARFQPLYTEMRQKIGRLNRIVSRKEHELSKGGHYTEEQYREALDQIYDSRIRADQVEKEYGNKYREFLSNEKIYKIHMAEIEFHRKILKKMIH